MNHSVNSHTLKASLENLSTGFQEIRKALLKKVFEQSKKPTVQTNPKEYFCVGICKDALCVIDFCHRAVDSFEREETTLQDIKMRSLDIEQALWTRKMIEQLITLIALNGKSEDVFHYYFSMTLLQSTYAKRENEKNFSWCVSTLAEENISFNLALIEGFRRRGIRFPELINEGAIDELKNKNLIEAKKIPGLRSWEKRFIEAIRKWTWGDRLLLGNFEMFYGDASNKIHANLDYYYDDLSSHDSLEQIGTYITRLLIRVGVYIQGIADLPGDYFQNPETEAEYESSYRSTFQKEFTPGTKVKCEIYWNWKIIEKCLVEDKNGYFVFNYSVRLDNGENVILPSPAIKALH